MSENRAFAAWVAAHAASYRTSRSETVALARSLRDDDLLRRTGDAGWTVRDELVHIAASDPDFIGVLGAIVSGKRPDTSIFAEIDRRNAENIAAWRSRSLTDVIGELERNGEALQQLLSRLTDDDDKRRPEGLPFAIGGVVAGFGQHEPYHAGQIRSALGQEKET